MRISDWSSDVCSSDLVWFGDRQLKLTPAGDFVFGINRDAPDSAELRVQLPGAAVVRYSHEIAKREYKIQHIDGLPPKMVTPPAGFYERIRADQSAVSAPRTVEGEGTGFLQAFIWPARPDTRRVGKECVCNCR